MVVALDVVVEEDVTGFVVLDTIDVVSVVPGVLTVLLGALLPSHENGAGPGIV